MGYMYYSVIIIYNILLHVSAVFSHLQIRYAYAHEQCTVPVDLQERTPVAKVCAYLICTIYIFSPLSILYLKLQFHCHCTSVIMKLWFSYPQGHTRVSWNLCVIISRQIIKTMIFSLFLCLASFILIELFWNTVESLFFVLKHRHQKHTFFFVFTHFSLLRNVCLVLDYMFRLIIGHHQVCGLCLS
jgi:hypothetical protein